MASCGRWIAVKKGRKNQKKFLLCCCPSETDTGQQQHTHTKMNTIALLGMSVVFFYSMVQIFRFYGLKESAYGMYVIFYLFLAICLVTLPKEYPKITAV